MVEIVENTNEGLKREYTLTIKSEIIKGKLENELKHIAANTNLPGFRPGKAPLAMIKKKHGLAALGDIMEKTVGESVMDLIEDKKLRPALRPDVKVENGEDYTEDSDLIFSVELEVLPEVPQIKWEDISLEKWVVTPSDDEHKQEMQKILDEHKQFKALEKKRKTQKGDTVIIDFVGKLNGVAFDGGDAKEFRLELGSGSFIPGFEEQLEGRAEGDEFVINVTFPEEYMSEELAGKDTTFDIKLHQILEPVEAEETEEFAKEIGHESLEDLRKHVTERIQNSFATLANNKIKKELFDILDEKYVFEIPQKMQQMEFDAMWKQFKDPENRSEEDKDKKEDEFKEELEKMAERRVRLGIMLADIGQKEKVEVSQEEIKQAVFMQAFQFQGQERQVIEFYQNNPDAMEDLRGPILERKVIELILENKLDVKEKNVSSKELEEAVE